MLTGKILIEKIGRNDTTVVAVGGLLETALLIGLQGIVTHQAGDAVTTYSQTVFT